MESVEIIKAIPYVASAIGGVVGVGIRIWKLFKPNMVISDLISGDKVNINITNKKGDPLIIADLAIISIEAIKEVLIVSERPKFLKSDQYALHMGVLYKANAKGKAERAVPEDSQIDFENGLKGCQKWWRKVRIKDYEDLVMANKAVQFSWKEIFPIKPGERTTLTIERSNLAKNLAGAHNQSFQYRIKEEGKKPKYQKLNYKVLSALEEPMQEEKEKREKRRAAERADTSVQEGPRYTKGVGD